MAEQQLDRMAGFMAHRDQPLIGVISHEKGQEVVHYFAEEDEADAASSTNAIHEVLSLAGAWSDLNWDVVEEELDRIRHENHPTPPISLWDSIYFLTYSILERYADLRRLLRSPYGAGLIGDIDTLIAATALERNLTIVTADKDFERVPGLQIKLISLK